jgi:DNA topoisomerase-1
MPRNLVIVESPAKAKTIAPFLGKDYSVKSSFGHIRDLPKKELGVDVAKHFKPIYQISPDKTKIVSELKSAAKGHTVWLASDPDREGEAIAWHVSVALGLDPKTTKRIVFHEITETAINKAIEHPSQIDMKLVDAQQARRILDRLVGYELSPILWKKIRAGLSAGRVQSVAVRLIVEREREIRAFKPERSFKVSAVFDAKGQDLPAELTEKLKDKVAAKSFLEAIQKAEFSVAAVEQKPGSRSPAAPFITSTLQQEAARRLGFSVRRTMTIAQRLYEAGHITYMRTDSTTLSGLATSATKDYILKNYGQRYYQLRQYKTRDKSAQEAHEAIRPSHPDKLSAGTDSSQKKLYELIWKRTMASQMAAASIQKTEVMINISDHKEQFLATGEVLIFDGFLKVYGGGKDDRILPSVERGQKLKLKALSALESYSKPPSRYSEASLVRKLEELGIGRPSTYAPTISTIQDRGYVEKKDLDGETQELVELLVNGGKVEERTQSIVVGADRNKLLSTQLADIVTDFLMKYFAEIMDYDFTAEAEKELDDIAEGRLTWVKMLNDFYEHFHPLIGKSLKASRSEAVQMRKLGQDPKSGQPVFARYGRYGPVLQLGETDSKKPEEEVKPRFAPLPSGATLEEIELKEALPMFNLPRKVGKAADGQAITADIGRFGPYIKIGSQFISIKDHDPLTITEPEAREVISDKQTTEAQRVVADFGKLKILRGPYGPYVTNGKKNVRVPKGQAPEKLTKGAAQELLDKAPVNNGRFKNRRAKK